MPADNSPRWILHVDMDAFFASVEVLNDPSLRGKPVIVGGTPEGRGVVASASYEARAFGIRSAMSAYRARELCPEAVFVRPHMERYIEISRGIIALFESYTPLVEPISIDEAFLDISGTERLYGSAQTVGREIKERIRRKHRLVASVGLAPNKFLAKLASDLSKPDGFLTIEAEKAHSFLGPLSVDKMWGVGKVTAKRLAEKGIGTIDELRRTPVDRLEEVVGSHAAHLIALAHGIDNRPVSRSGETKSVGAEHTFAQDISEEADLIIHLDRLAERVARRLRRRRYRAHTIQLKARYPDFTTVTRALTLSAPTAATKTIRETARWLLTRKLERKARPLRLMGVSASNLVRSDAVSATLFADDPSDQREKVDHLVDTLQERFGRGSIWVGGKKPHDHREEPAEE